MSRFRALVAVAGLAAGAVVAAPTAVGAARAWSVVPSPNPAASTGNELRGVACPHPNSCFAVGTSSNGSAQKSLIEHWNGRAWHIVTSSPDRSVTSALSAVACPSTTSCFVVGTHATTAQPNSRAFVEHWNGHHWAVMPQSTPYRVTGDAVLRGIACPYTLSCFAVGFYESASLGQHTLIEHWNGHHWAIMNHIDPNPAGKPTFAGVSCPSMRSCFAVGSRTVGGDSRPLIEHWNGRVWTIMAGAVVPGANEAELNGVACPFLPTCFAVGAFSGTARTRPLVEHWNGRHWGYMPVVNPHSNDAVLRGVACPAQRSCFVVGSYTAGATVKTFVEHWNGTAWTISAVPAPPSTTAELAAVACALTKSCAAVGDQASSTQTLAYAYA